MTELQEHDFANLIRSIPDYPKPGIVFRDITPLLGDGAALAECCDALARQWSDKAIDRIAGIEARGFVFGSVVAHSLGCGFVPIRKPGKLPAEYIRQEYDLEYGSDALEVHRDGVREGERILLIDDLIATGGSAMAASGLLKRLGADCVGAGFVIELAGLGGRTLLENAGVECRSLVTYHEG